MKELLSKSQLFKQLKMGEQFSNPGGGTSIVVGINDDNIAYLRQKSRIYLPIQSFLDVYALFQGKRCDSNDLKKYDAGIFDSQQKGHSCNCTFLFLLAEKLGLTQNGIEGEGKRGNPFYVVFK